MFYEAVFRALQKHKVRYVVVGGVAVVLHGIGRFTADLDLIVDLSSDNLRKLLDAMKEAGFLPRLPVTPEEFLSAEKRKEWMTEKNFVVFSFWNTKNSLEMVDILLEASEDVGIFQRSQGKNVHSLRVRLASVDDLIAMKSHTGRKKDEADVEDLKKLKGVQHEDKG